MCAPLQNGARRHFEKKLLQNGKRFCTIRGVSVRISRRYESDRARKKHMELPRPHRLARSGHQIFILATGVQIPLGMPLFLVVHSGQSLQEDEQKGEGNKKPSLPYYLEGGLFLFLRSLHNHRFFPSVILNEAEPSEESRLKRDSSPAFGGLRMTRK